MRKQELLIGFLFIMLLFVACSKKSEYEKEAIKKIDTLETLMEEAREKSIDVTREETSFYTMPALPIHFYCKDLRSLNTTCQLRPHDHDINQIK